MWSRTYAPAPECFIPVESAPVKRALYYSATIDANWTDFSDAEQYEGLALIQFACY